MNLLAKAKELGAVTYSGGLCLPAARLAEFLTLATKADGKIRYHECLCFHEADGAAPDGTEPSMELSRDFVPGQSEADFFAQAAQLAEMAVERAASRGIRPYYQVGLEPDLDPLGAGIRIRL
jgi:hypothetical protein